MSALDDAMKVAALAVSKRRRRRYMARYKWSYPRLSFMRRHLAGLSCPDCIPKQYKRAK
jgi:hypothetical protein